MLVKSQSKPNLKFAPVESFLVEWLAVLPDVEDVFNQRHQTQRRCSEEKTGFWKPAYADVAELVYAHA